MVKKLKESKTNGAIGISNVGSSKAECITLTYSLKENLQSLENIMNVRNDMDAVHKEESKVTVTITNFSDPEVQDFQMKYQIKACNNEKLARTIKADLDDYVNKNGGQTTLDEQEF